MSGYEQDCRDLLGGLQRQRLGEHRCRVARGGEPPRLAIRLDLGIVVAAEGGTVASEVPAEVATGMAVAPRAGAERRLSAQKWGRPCRAVGGVVRRRAARRVECEASGSCSILPSK